MNTNDTVKYLVGREDDNEFWCVYETTSLEQAKAYFNKVIREPKDVWYIYEQRTTHKMLESTQPSKNPQALLAHAMVAAI